MLSMSEAAVVSVFAGADKEILANLGLEVGALPSSVSRVLVVITSATTSAGLS